MKIFLIYGLSFFIGNISVAQTKAKEESKFEVLNIDSLHSVYFIYAKRNDSIIKIVSKKENLINCELILKGKSYKLEIESLLKYSASKRHIGGVKYNGILIKLEGGHVIWDLFISEDLKGLCYTPKTTNRCRIN